MIDKRYRIGRKLGDGAMGCVYEAEHVGLGTRVAVKILRSDVVERNPNILERFRREARAAARVPSKHIVQVLDLGEDDGVSFIVMEQLSGMDLRSLLKLTRTLRPVTVLKIASQVCVGLRSAHAAGVVHRDIKPANLFLSRHERGGYTVKVLDFGVAKILGEVAGALTPTGTVIGSPHYMSPEQARGEPTGHEADLWGLGATMFEMLSGTRPYASAKGFGEVILAIALSPAAVLQAKAPWLRPELSALVQRTLLLNPVARFATAGELSEAIAALMPDDHRIYADDLQPHQGDIVDSSRGGTVRCDRPPESLTPPTR